MTRITSLAGLPIEQHNSPNIGGAMSAHRGVVLHIAEGSYRGTINWQMNPDQRYASGGSVTTSSTWIVGRERGEWAQMVDSNRTAWCQRDGSRTWLSIELAGRAPQAPSAWQVEACAQLLAWAHRTHGIPVQVAVDPSGRGLGHHSMDREWLGEEWGHDSCPGSGVVAAKAAIVARARQIITPPPPAPPAPPPYRFPIALLALEGDTVPIKRIKHKNHPEYFAVFASGLVRHVGPAEDKVYADAGVALVVTEDQAEYDRLLKYTRALQD